MQYAIDVQLEVPLAPDLVELLKKAALATLCQQAVDAPAGLAILVSGDGRLRQLNADFNGLDEATDVLSFPAGEPMPGMDGDGIGEPRHLGDVAISLPYAEKQAAERGHKEAAELQLLVIHGVLHILGHDHAGERDKARMWEAQAAVLTRLGVSVTVGGDEAR